MPGNDTTVGYKVGFLDLYSFDLAVAEGLGAVLDPVKNLFYVDLDFMVQGADIHEPIKKAQVVFSKSEPTNIDMVVPEIIINRDNVVPAYNRRLSIVQEYKIPAPGAFPVSIGDQLGWSAYEMKDKAQPFDLYYTISVWARYRQVAHNLLQTVMAKYGMDGKVTVIDSIGNPGIYAVYHQGTADLTQVTNMVDRIVGLSMSIKVEAELTLNKTPVITNPVLGNTSTGPIPGVTPTDGSAPDPGPGGLYGSGRPILRVGIIEDY